jgi:16S rRNA (uracil1498-N3)-methyltransferase
MQVFFDPDLSAQTVRMNREASHHAVRVLRLREGHHVRITNGRGTMAESVVLDPDPEGCTIQIRTLHHNYQKRPYHVHVAMAPPKSQDRYEWFLEKATEIGVDEITPILCDHSERKRTRQDRSERILQAAMLQAGHAFLPVVHALQPFREFIQDRASGPLFIAHCQSRATLPLCRSIRAGMNGIVLIGPEGDFSEDEIDFARKHGAQEVRLGNARFRTETAGLIACHTFSLINQK